MIKLNSKKKPLVSIIIRTYNEEDWIESCIDSIGFQNFKNYEIIIIDNYSTDQTLNIIKKYDVRVLKIKKYLPGKSLNIGIKASKGKYIVCLSAHCIPKDNNWLKSLINPLTKKDSKVVAVYGRQEPYSYSSALDKRDLINTFGLDRKIQVKDPFFHNANSSLKVSIWKRFKFDEKVKNIEDRLWGKKIIDQKFKIQYEPNASVFHWHGINHSQDEKRAESIIKILENNNNFFSYQKSKKYSLISKGVALIPIKGKDLNSFKNLNHVINILKNIDNISKILISTDNKKIYDYVKNIDIKVIPVMRPDVLSNKFTDIFDVAKYSITKKLKLINNINFVTLVQIDYPFVNQKLIQEMINNFLKKGCNSLVAAKIEKRSFEVFRSNISKKHIDYKNLIPKNLKDDKLIILLTGLCTIINFDNLINGSWRYSNINYYEVDDIYSIKDKLKVQKKISK